MEFSLKMEAISIVIVAVLLFFNHGEQSVSRTKDRWFVSGLILSIVSSCINILSTWAIRYYQFVPLWMNVSLTSLYFVAIIVTAGVVALYIFHLIYEHINDKSELHTVYRINVGMLVVIVAMLVVNLFNGCIFYFQDGVYCRGILNGIGYVGLGVDLVIGIVCFMRNRYAVNRDVKKMIRILPGVAVAVVGFQFAYRDVMMNGMLLALVNVIMFISFQNIHLGVDGLTGLGNRGAFVEELSQWTATKKRFHVVFVNLREFRQVNQKFGQAAGDEFLYVIGNFLNDRPACARAYRLGSVNFAILCNNEHCDRIGHCIEEIQERFKHAWQAAGVEYRLSACYADLLWEGQNWNSAQIIDRLEYTMELAKAQGENTRVFFDEKIDQMMLREKYVIEQMTWAAAKRSYEVYFQPIYCWRDEVFCSAEALVRLRDKMGNMIMPGEFVPIAEKTGMIRDMSWIVVEKVCAFLDAHRELPLKAVSVNLSRQQFMDEDLEERLESLLRRYHVDPHKIKIEVTEGTIAKNPKRTERIMEELVQKGIGFYLDDFGVGYSNFSSVMRLPFETIKLDKSLTDKVLSTEKAHRFVGKLVKLFISSDYSVVAEGAEDAETVAELKNLGIDRIQGYYFAKPMPEKEFIEFLNKKA